MKILLFILFIIPQILFSQKDKLAAFDNLINKTWEAEGKWGDGSVFKQEVTFQYSLDSNIVIAQANGFTDKEQRNFGPRNHGIRKYDTTSDKVKFWEFDVFGGLTEGTVSFVNKDILYQYQYGDSYVTDMWEFKNDSVYNFKVGNYEDGEWKQIYLSAQFKAVKTGEKEQVFSMLKKRLVGKWSSEAWDGELNETWKVDKNGHINQTAEYVENGEVLYEATNKIELVNGEIILFTVIKDNNPKIFKAVSISKTEIVFENSDYKNPDKVVYDFSPKGEFHRTISGTEGEKPTTYAFKFKRRK